MILTEYIITSIDFTVNTVILTEYIKASIDSTVNTVILTEYIIASGTAIRTLSGRTGSALVWYSEGRRFTPHSVQ